MLFAFKKYHLDLNSNGGLKLEHLKSSSSTSKIIWLLNLAELQGNSWNATQKIHMILWSRGLSKLGGRPKAFCFHYHSGYGYQTWKENHLPWWVCTHKVTWHSQCLLLEGHLTNWNHYFSPIKVPMASKFD